MAFLIATKLLSRVNPKLIVSEYGKIWLDDTNFFDEYRRLVGTPYTSADRKFLLRSLLSLAAGLPGDTAECGVYQGASSWLICAYFRDTDKMHYLFDSFEGLSAPVTVDGNYWHQGDMVGGEALALHVLSEYRVTSYRGWIPERFVEVLDNKFCFVHIDVDLYQPTLDSLSFFYPRMVPGGIILCDDYGFATCPGAKAAFDEYMMDKPEQVIHMPTGQGFIVKRYTD